jgi:plasmid maintenance system antidote protein VapI
VINSTSMITWGLFPTEIGVDDRVTFKLLLFRLRELLKEKVKNGELTERGMARSTGFSQPHLHNILKGIRTLPPELADQLMSLAGLNLFNLIGIKQTEEGVGKGRSARELQSNMSEIERVIAKLDAPMLNLPSYSLPDDASMEPRFHGGDIAHYQPGAVDWSMLNGRSAYLVNHNERLCARYLRMGGQRLYLVSEESLKDPMRWEYVSLADRHILEIVTGRIVWICRKVDEAETSAAEETRGRDRRVS